MYAHYCHGLVHEDIINNFIIMFQTVRMCLYFFTTLYYYIYMCVHVYIGLISTTALEGLLKSNLAFQVSNNTSRGFAGI